MNKIENSMKYHMLSENEKKRIEKNAPYLRASKKLSVVEQSDWDKKNQEMNKIIFEGPLFEFLDKNPEDINKDDEGDLAMLIDNLY